MKLNSTLPSNLIFLSNHILTSKFQKRRENRILQLLCSLALFLFLSEQVFAQRIDPDVPVWVGSTNLVSDDGFAHLEWVLDPSVEVELYRLDENRDGTWISTYVIGTTEDLFRGVPNTYQFRLSACTRVELEELDCGSPSSILELEVTNKIFDPYRVSELPPIQPSPPPVEPPGGATSGGPGTLSPGRWYYPDPTPDVQNPENDRSPKPGQGWSFYWNNLIDGNPSDGYDLFAVWYTFEAKRFLCEGDAPGKGKEGGSEGCVNGPETQYTLFRPVVLTAKLTKLNDGAYRGAIYHYVNSSQCSNPNAGCNIGNVDVVFSPEKTEAKVTWTMAFVGTFVRVDSGGAYPYNIALLTGDEGPGDPQNIAPTDLAGLWNPNGNWNPVPGNTGNWPIYAAGLGTFSETSEVVFFDEGGVLTWIFGYSPNPPVDPNDPNDPENGERFFCFKYLNDGYKPELYDPDFEEVWWYGVDDLCSDVDINGNYIVTEQHSNGSRKFTGFRDANLWVDFELPTDGIGDPADPYSGPVGGSIEFGTKNAPAPIKKFAKFHDIWFDGNPFCSLNEYPHSCTPTLTWFTDGDYPNATVYARKAVDPGDPPVVFLVTSDSLPVVENFSEYEEPITLAGTYTFELRKGHPTNPNFAINSRLIAESDVFFVTGTAPQSPEMPTGLVINLDPSVWEFEVSWDTVPIGTVDRFDLEETVPGESPVVLPPINPPDISMSFNKIGGPYGTYSYRVRACNEPNLCSAWTAAETWVVPPPGNQPPYFANWVHPPDLANTAYVEFRTEVIDPDGNPLTCSISNANMPNDLSIDEEINGSVTECLIDGVVNDDVGFYIFDLVVSDGTASTFESVIWQIHNTPPFFDSAVTELQFAQGEQTSRNIPIGDVDPGQGLTCSYDSGDLPTGLTVVEDSNDENCIISGSTNDPAGTYNVTLSLTDSASPPDSDSLTIDIVVSE